jgi:hypothetical protein
MITELAYCSDCKHRRFWLQNRIEGGHMMRPGVTYEYSCMATAVRARRLVESGYYYKGITDCKERNEAGMCGLFESKKTRSTFLNRVLRRR